MGLGPLTPRPHILADQVKGCLLWEACAGSLCQTPFLSVPRKARGGGSCGVRQAWLRSKTPGPPMCALGQIAETFCLFPHLRSVDNKKNTYLLK